MRINRASAFANVMTSNMAEKEQLSVSMTTAATIYHATCCSVCQMNAWNFFALSHENLHLLVNFLIFAFYVDITGSFLSSLA